MTNLTKKKLSNFLKYLILISFLFIIDWTLRDTFHERAFVGIVVSLVLLQFSKKLFYLYLIPNIVMLSLYLPNKLYSGPISYNSVEALKYTNSSESIEYMQGIPLFYYGAAVLLIITSFVIAKFKFGKIPKQATYGLLFVLLVLATKDVYGVVKYGVNNRTTSPILRNSFYPAASLAYKYHSFNEQIKEKEDILHNEDTQGWEITTTKPMKEVYVVVVGESSRKDLMNCYGFPINNTPFASSTPHVTFDQYISIGASTVTSLTRALYLSEKITSYNKYKNIISLADQAQIHTTWLSNQGAVGRCDNPISIIGRLAETNVFLKKGEFFNDNFPDSLLLNSYREAVKKENGPQLIVLHLMGSHPKVSDRTNNHYDTFYQTEQLSHYVQTVKNTDYLLGKVYEQLKNSGKSFSLVYFSDHGLSMVKDKINNDYCIKHSDQYKECYNVPLLIWGSDITENEYITHSRYSNDFLFLMAELMGVELKEKKHTAKFISHTDYPNEQKILNFNNEITTFEELKENKVF